MMPDLRTLPATIYLLVGSLAVLLGVVIFRENTRDRIHRVTAAMLGFVGLKAIHEGLAFSLELTSSAAPTAFTAFRPVGYLWELFFPTLVLFASVFPVEHRYLKRVRWAWLLLFIPHTFHFLLLLLTSFGVREARPGPQMEAQLKYWGNLVHLGRVAFNLLLSVQISLFSLVNIGYVAAAVALLLASYRASWNPRLKGQLRIITWGLGSCVGLYILAEPVPTLLRFELSGNLRQAMVVVALALGVGSIAYSIVRHRFLDTPLLARRSILYAAVTAILVGLYLTVVRQIQDFLAGVVGIGVPVIEPVFLVLALILFQPALVRLEELIDRFFLRDRLDHRNILRQLSRDVITILDRRQLTERIVSTLSEGVLARHPTLIDFEAEPGRRVVSSDLSPEQAGEMEAAVDSLRALPVVRDFMHRDQLAGPPGSPEAMTLDVLRRADIKYLLPVRYGGRVPGLLMLGRKVTGLSYTAEEISLLTTLANQVGVALQNASLYRQSLDKAVMEEELALARKIQERLLPAAIPSVFPFEISAVNVPSKQVGGDFYDLVDLRDGRVLFAIADVAGKGVPAALLTSMLQASLRTQVAVAASPGTILRNLNALTWEFTGSDQFATFFLGVLDSRRCELTYVNAGHNYPFLVRPDGSLRQLEEGGLLLGAFPGIEWSESRVPLCHGDRLVVYTDGVTEARPPDRDEEYGERRFLEQLGQLNGGSSREMIEEILADVAAYAGEEQADDITLIIVRVLEDPCPTGE